jgi:Spy/CpxP family protein refolding chaperone
MDTTSQQKETNMIDRKTTIAALLMTLGLFGATVALSQQDFGPPPGPPPGRGPGMDQAMFLSLLDLTDAQKSRINTIDAAERSLSEPIAAQLRDAHKAVEDAVAAGQFDEQQIRTLAAAEAQLQVELTVARARRQAAIYQILTSEQQTRLTKLRQAQRSPDAFSPGFRRQQ